MSRIDHYSSGHGLRKTLGLAVISVSSVGYRDCKQRCVSASDPPKPWLYALSQRAPGLGFRTFGRSMQQPRRLVVVLAEVGLWREGPGSPSSFAMISGIP